MADTYLEIPNPYSPGGFPIFREVPPASQPDVNPYVSTDTGSGEKTVAAPGNVFLPGIVEAVRKAERRGHVPVKLSEDVKKQIEANMGDEIWVFSEQTPEELAKQGARDPFRDVADITPHPERLEGARTAFVKAIERDPLKYLRPELSRRVRDAALAAILDGKEFHTVFFHNLDGLAQAGRDELAAMFPGQPWAPVAADAMKQAVLVSMDLITGKKKSLMDAVANHRYAIAGGVLAPGINQLLTDFGIYPTIDKILPGASKELAKLITDLSRGLANQLLLEQPTSRISDLLVGGLFEGPDYISQDPAGYYAEVFSRASEAYSGTLMTNFIDALQELRTRVSQGADAANSTMAQVKDKISTKVTRDSDGTLHYTIPSPQKLATAATDKKDLQSQADRYHTLAQKGQKPKMTWKTASGREVPFTLLPARRSHGVGAGGSQAPGVGAGISFRTMMNIVALNIPGRGPELQPFGIKGEYIEYVAAFLGYDPEAEKIQEKVGVGNSFVQLRELGLAWDESETAAEVVRRGEDITLSIITGAMHIVETGKVEELERIGVRDDLVWYRVRFRVKSNIKECEKPKKSDRTDGYEVIDIGQAPVVQKSVKDPEIPEPPITDEQIRTMQEYKAKFGWSAHHSLDTQLIAAESRRKGTLGSSRYDKKKYQAAIKRTAFDVQQTKARVELLRSLDASIAEAKKYFDMEPVATKSGVEGDQAAARGVAAQPNVESVGRRNKNANNLPLRKKAWDAWSKWKAAELKMQKDGTWQKLTQTYEQYSGAK